MSVYPKDKDPGQITKAGFDDALQRHKVEALISDGIDALLINPDGSINANTQNSIIGVAFDSIYASYPSDTLEIYTYKMSGNIVATVTVTYTDLTKEEIVSVVRS